MAAGYNLSEGTFKNCNTSEDELWASLSCLFSTKSIKDSSYKYGFLKAIIDNLYNVDDTLSLSFNQVFSKFAEIYWNLILKYDVRQKAKTKDNRETYLEQIINNARIKYNITEPIPYESLTPKMMLDINLQVKNKCKKYVIGAVFEDTNHLFYSFSKKEEKIQLNPKMYQFICKHKLMIEKINYYEWAKFLEKVNEPSSSQLLLSKLDKSSKRSNLSKYREILYNVFENHNCFYCGKHISFESSHVDHFIPWSFIKDDNLWNFVLACPSCNNKKRDRLAIPEYLNTIEQRNQKILCSPEHFIQNYKPRKIVEIYNWAAKNGYENSWQPRLLTKGFEIAQ